MDRVVKRVAPRIEEIHEPPVWWCDHCGSGAGVGSEAAEYFGYGEDKPCPHCGYQVEIQERTWVRHERGYVVIRCDCGINIECDDAFLNSCLHCEREYNGEGQLLAPREQWGVDTGESVADIMGQSW